MINPEEILEIAKQAGAAEAEVYQMISRSHPVFFEANRLKQLETTESEGIALRVWREGAPGVTVAYGEITAEALVERALALCPLNPPETIELSADHRQVYPTQGNLVSRDELVEIGNNAVVQLSALNSSVICSGELDCEQHTTRLLNTRGTDCQYTDISLSAFFQVEWVRGEDFLGITDGIESADTLDLKPVQQRIAQGMTWAQETVTPPQGRVPIIFTPKSAPLFWETVIAALNGKRVWEGSSPWADRAREQVISDQITLWQDPTRNPERCPFDDEGMATQHLTLIEKGQLKEFYRDRAIGRLLGTGSTGNGFRPSLGRYPTPSLINLMVAPGKETLETLISQLDHGLVIDQLLGGDADLSGDFSANIELGYRVEQGKVTGRVKDTMVAGNIYTALNHLIALSQDVQINESYVTPSVMVDGLSVIS
ncbi:MAG: TldD/PmbA family protein [Halothece sp. Uz-M2-17]|nr:TldD/PmbA family protein [Halothece sp. Uz-M2-17]